VRPRSSSPVDMSEVFADATSQPTLPTRVSDMASLHPARGNELLADLLQPRTFDGYETLPEPARDTPPTVSSTIS
jgi:hypothetical protein